MFYGNTVQETRQLFFDSWEKYLHKKPLTPLEQQIVDVLLVHPEYHQVLQQVSKFQEHTYYPELGETNPFLHMGLHLAIREQIATDRPTGIKNVYQNLLKKYQDPLNVEHIMMEHLAECLWLSQKNNTLPDEAQYLTSLTALCHPK
ncbi:MAG TPA: DUF1841 family protein [Legionella sp.]|nr:DUF1841 family protein [Legionella sp.]